MKKVTKWKCFDFGHERCTENEFQPKSALTESYKISKKNRPKNVIVNQKTNLDFNKILIPQVVGELAVHPKKIQEVEGWLKTVLLNTSEKKKTQFLLITGPTGCGKATTIQVICKSLNVSITEWVNPVDIDYELIKGPGQVMKFLSFFSEGKYSSLFSTGNEKKIFLIKDVPNAFIRSPEDFFSVLEDIFYMETHPIIFICTESNYNEINLQRILFPEEIQLKYAITHFSFNACAPTLLKKGLKRAQDIIQNYPEKFHIASAPTIEAIIASSMGDIQCAMNQYYLSCLKDKIGSKRKRSDQSVTVRNMFRDETLGLFHGLGRVLNPKRKVEGTSWRLNCDVEKLVGEFSIQPSKFLSFLFENYLKYFGDIDDVENAADCLSFSTVLMENWDNHDVLTVALWLSVLGLMIFNEHKVSKWNQIKGPRKIEKIRSQDEKESIHPTDRYYYNIITKTQKYHGFKCDNFR